MSRPSLEVADIFRHHGHLWRQSHHGHISLGQLKVMSAIERCRSAELGGHVLFCQACDHQQIAYNSCRNRHCPKCQASAAHRWLEARQADLLPVDYYHLVFTLPAQISDLAFANKGVIYNLLFQAAAQTLQVIAKDPKHLGAKIGVTLVLHTWGSAMTHHPHVHGVVTGGGLSRDGKQWVACKPGFFLPVRVLSRLYRRLFLEKLTQAYQLNQLQFFAEQQAIKEEKHFMDWIKSLSQIEWVVYAKRPFAGPAAVLAYLSRYTHRVAIANSRLLSMDENGITFKWKDYRRKNAEAIHIHDAGQQMSLSAAFLSMSCPAVFIVLRHYGLIANANRKDNLARARKLLKVNEAELPAQEETTDKHQNEEQAATYVCPDCGAPMIIIETFPRSQQPRAPPVKKGGT